MTVWVVLWEDDVEIFATQEQAICFARQVAQDTAPHPAYVAEQTYGDIGTPSWRMIIEYSSKDGQATVMERDVQTENAEAAGVPRLPMSPEQEAEAKANIQSLGYPTWAKADFILQPTQEP